MNEPSHILVVDDDASIRRMLEILLTDAGYRVSTAASGEEALAYVELVTPDLMLLDLMLPGITGREVAQRIKANRQRLFIPIILVTALSDSQTRVTGLDAGADDFLSKPLEFAELLARVRSLLRLQRSQRSLQAEQRKTELLLHLTRELGTTLDLDDLLTHFLEKLADAIGAVRASIILTLNADTTFYSSSRFSSTIDLNQLLTHGAAGWVLREKQPMIIADCQEDSRWISTNDYHSTIRSIAAAPIIREGRVLGVITVVHHTPNHFREEHLDLLTSVAQQSAVTLEHAELFRLTRSQKELLERRTDELQRLNEISRHLSELMQPELLMRLVTHLVQHTFRYPQVTIMLCEVNGLRIGAVAGTLDPNIQIDTVVPANRGISNWVVQQRSLLNVGDVRADSRYYALDPASDATRSEMAVPISAGRELYGVLDVASDQLQAFDANDERLLGTLASQIAVALANGQLFDTEKRRVRQLGQVNDLSVAITARMDQEQNLRTAANALVSIFGIQRAGIIVYNAPDRRGTFATSDGALQLPAALADRLIFSSGSDAITITDSVIIADVANDHRFSHLQQLLQAEHVESMVLTPLRSSGTPIGVLALDATERFEQFGQAELTLLATVASLLGQVIDNDRLYDEVEDERRTLNAVLDGAADPILLIDPQDRLLLSNRAAAQQLGIVAATGQPLTTLIHKPELLNILTAPTNGGSPHEVALDDMTTFSVSIAPVRSGHNNTLGRVAVLQDISAIKELERREQERLRSALRRYVSPQVVEQLLAGGSDFGTPVDREVVVLFIDIRGYTALTAGINARVLVEEVLNRYFTSMTEVLYRYEGTIDKFLGDGMIGVFGTPLSHDDDLQRSLLAAVDLQHAFNRLRHEWQAKLRLDIGMGIGIGYGHAVVGNIGSIQRTDFTLIGDVVNTTSRLNGLAKAGQIIVSHTLVDALPASWQRPFTLRSLGPVALRGKPEPHDVYELQYIEQAYQS